MRMKRGDKEYSQEQRLKHENQKLKKQVKQLRKLLSRIPVELYQNIEEAIEKQRAIELREQKMKKKERQKKIWECFECQADSLRIFILNRRDGTFYFRQCPTCKHRTKLQKHSDDVEGLNL